MDKDVEGDSSYLVNVEVIWHEAVDAVTWPGAIF